MPPLPVVPQTIKCDLVFTIGVDLTALTRFYVTYTGSAPDAAELNTFAGAIGTAWVDELKAYTDDSSSLDAVYTVDLSSATSPQGAAGVGVAGTRGAAFLSADSAVVITYDQTRRYRGGHARGYWRLGVEGDLLNAQEWTTAFIGDVLTQIEAFFAAVLAAGWSGAGSLSQSQVSYFEGFTVVISPTTGRARNVPTKRVSALVNSITGYVVRPRVGSQRRRLGKS